MINGPILNSLLRLNGTVGTPPPPFERPNPQFDFFVLELWEEGDLSTWCERTLGVLGQHTDYLEAMRGDGVSITLFVAYSASAPVLRFEAGFLQELARLGISLEIYCEPNDAS